MSVDFRISQKNTQGYYSGKTKNKVVFHGKRALAPYFLPDFWTVSPATTQGLAWGY